MSDIVRSFVVRSVEPGIGDPTRVHAIVTVRNGIVCDGTMHLFTGDPVLAACLVPGVELELRALKPAGALRG